MIFAQVRGGTRCCAKKKKKKDAISRASNVACWLETRRWIDRWVLDGQEGRYMVTLSKGQRFIVVVVVDSILRR